MTQTKLNFNGYEGFIDKFKPKLTTDDCYTPPEIYEVVLDYTCNRWNIKRYNVVRPFQPNGDYQNFDYPENCCVVDNPPFSILGQIKNFYVDKNIKFFLFAPGLTLFAGNSIAKNLCHIAAMCDITYHNGANVRTSFVTNLKSDNVIESAPNLHRQVKKVNDALKKQKQKHVTNYEYPPQLLTAARAGYFSVHGVDFAVKKGECLKIEKLDAMPPKKKIFGGGVLLSDSATKSRQAAEQQVIYNDLNKQEEERNFLKIELSEREKEMIGLLDKSE